MSKSPEVSQYQEKVKQLGVDMQSYVLNETALEEVLSNIQDQIDTLVRLQQQHDVAGAYGIVYAELCTYAARLVQESEVTAQVVYLYYAPVIKRLRDCLQGKTVMPLAEFENYLRSLGWQQDTIYTTTG